MQLILCKDNANERNENLFSNCRVQLILCKSNKKWVNEQISDEFFNILSTFLLENLIFSTESLS